MKARRMGGGVPYAGDGDKARWRTGDAAVRFMAKALPGRHALHLFDQASSDAALALLKGWAK